LTSITFTFSVSNGLGDKKKSGGDADKIKAISNGRSSNLTDHGDGSYSFTHNVEEENNVEVKVEGSNINGFPVAFTRKHLQEEISVNNSLYQEEVAKQENKEFEKLVEELMEKKKKELIEKNQLSTSSSDIERPMTRSVSISRSAKVDMWEQKVKEEPKPAAANKAVSGTLGRKSNLAQMWENKTAGK